MRRKKLVVPAIITLAVVFAIFMVYFIAIYRAESLLQQLIKTQSNGNLIFNVGKVKLDIIHLRFDFRYPELRTSDTTSNATRFNIRANNISFKIKSILPFLWARQIIIDSIHVLNPEIEVLKYKETVRKKISLPEEMIKVYKSLDIVLNILRLNYLYIEAAKFKIFDGSYPSNKPLEVSRLNLTVNKVFSEKIPGSTRFLFADRILLDVFNQDISFLDGLHGIKFKRFRLNTENQTIKLDSCYIYGKQADSSRGMFTSFVDTLRISKLDLNLLVNDDILKMDSALCINPEVTFLIPLNEKQKTKISFSNDLINKAPLDFVLKKMLGNLDIGYLKIRNAKVKIVTKKGNESKIYNTSNSNFSIEKFVINSDPKVPIQIGQFNLDVHNYIAYSTDSLYVVKFDDVQVRNHKISLLNFRIGPTDTNHELLSREIVMDAFEFNNINWPILIYESRIVADNVILVKPELHFKLTGAKMNTTDSIRQNPFIALEEIRKKIQIDDILIKDGSIHIEDLKKTNISVNHLNARLNVNQLLQSTNVYRLTDAIDTLTFDNGEYRNPSIQFLMKEGSFSKRNNSLRLGQIKGKNADQSTLAKMSNVNLNGIRINASENYSVAKLSWAKADLTLNIGKNAEAKNKSKALISNYKLTIGNLSGGPTLLNFCGNNIEASTRVNRISTEEIVFENGHTPRISGLNIDGQSFVLDQKQVKSTISDYKIRDQQVSTLNNVIIRLPTSKELINVSIPKLIFSADIYKSINGKITADFIELQKPIISFTTLPESFNKKTKETDSGFPLMNIGRLTIDQPEITSLTRSLPANMLIDPGKSNWNVIRLNSDNKTIKADSIRITLIQPYFRYDKIKMIPTGKEYVSLTGSDFAINHSSKDNKSNCSVNMNILKSSGLQFSTLLADTSRYKITIDNLNLENLILTNNMSDFHDLIKNSDHFLLSNGNIAIENSKTRIATFNLSLDKSIKSLVIDSISISPLVNKSAFMNSRKYQGDYMQLFTGLIKAKGIDFNLLINNGIINSKKLTINDLYFYDYKDKRLPFQHGIEKPLLTDLLKRIKPKISIDSILLKNSGIVYEEFNDKTQQVGKVKLSKIRGVITGVKSDDFSPTDSVRFNLYARFIDASDLKVSYAQSYTDSLSSFQLKVIASSFNLRTLNSLLKPLASARVKSGYLDTIRMSVVGRKHVAYGIMKLYYHDLNVQYLNKGIEEARTLKSRLISFFANRIVKNKNLDDSGEVYAERDPEKGFVNYWLKIFIGGLFTNTGVRTDNKQEKKYFQSIEKYKVPPIPDIPVDY